jgi:hypothetical protein
MYQKIAVDNSDLSEKSAGRWGKIHLRKPHLFAVLPGKRPHDFQHFLKNQC